MTEHDDDIAELTAQGCPFCDAPAATQCEHFEADGRERGDQGREAAIAFAESVCAALPRFLHAPWGLEVHVGAAFDTIKMASWSTPDGAGGVIWMRPDEVLHVSATLVGGMTVEVAERTDQMEIALPTVAVMAV